MIEIVTNKHYFETECQTLVNPINCAGTWGKGLALEFKKMYPAMYADYMERFRQGELKPGVPYFYDRLKIVNFPTKNSWRSPARTCYIYTGLEIFCRLYKEWGITSAAFPALGCGNGGLTWGTVILPMMVAHLEKLDIPIEIYAPKQ